jgi:flagellar basal body rod protein FlgG
MLPAISNAASGMATQSERIEAVAQVVSALGATAPAGTTEAAGRPPVRVAALPVGETLEQAMVSLVEAEHAYRMNAAVLATADGMLDTLLHTLDAE